MKLNEGKLDRIIRFVLGLLLIVLWPFGFTQGTFAVVLAVVGAVLVATSLAGFCPLYAVLGIKTCPLTKS
ncbi:MAG: DUF2892 domain-containing protein [Trueperaceae bacterium]|nr:DUF2892 domain-containing protein [Trueperaceae bacterium]